MATAYRAIPKDWTFLGLLCLVILTAGCGSAAYNEQLEKTANELQQQKSAAPAGGAKKDTTEDTAAAPQPAPEPANKKTGAGGTGIGNAIGLAPM